MDLKEDNIIPIFAHAFFCGSKEGNIKQVLQFDYHDPNCFYKEIEQNEREFNKELNKLSLNMQSFLDEEKNYINNQQVYPKVKFIDIEFRVDTMPFITWIIEFEGIFKKGINEYLAITPEEKLDYNCRSIWSFTSKTRIIKVETRMIYEINENHIVFWANKDDIIGGKELIRFIM